MTSTKTQSVLTVAGLVVLLLAAVAIWRITSPLDVSYSCTWRGTDAFESAESYVRATIPDASGFETVDFDCEEGGQAGLEFSSGLTPAALRDVLTTAGCQSLEPASEPSGQDALCTNDPYDFQLVISARPAGGSDAELHASWR